MGKWRNETQGLLVFMGWYVVGILVCFIVLTFAGT